MAMGLATKLVVGFGLLSAFMKVHTHMDGPFLKPVA
jgi:hypothetical protein